MDHQSRLLALVDSLYAAPGRADGWLGFLDLLCTELDGSGASFISLSPDDGHANVSETVRTDPEALTLYRQHWGATDPWGHSPSMPRTRPATVVLGDQLISHSALKETGFYRDFGRIYDIVRSVIGVVERGPTKLSVISINRTERRGSFDDADAALLTALMPHLQCGLELHRRLVSSETRCASLADAIDCTADAVLIVSPGGRVTHMNSAAVERVRMRDGLTIDSGELQASSNADTRRLRVAVADACRTSTGDGWKPGGALALQRPSGRRALTALVSPLTSAISDRSTPGGAMVVVSDPEEARNVDDDLLRTVFGLTPAEASLTRTLAQGMSTREAAAHLNLRIETVRSRIKAVLHKTGARRQSELMRLVLNSTQRRL